MKSGSDHSGIEIPDEFRQACITLTGFNISGGFDTPGTNDPELYGRICVASSEDPHLTSNGESLDSQLQNCKNLWFVKDTNPFADPVTTGAATVFTNAFNSRTVQDLKTMYKGPSSPPTLSGRQNINVSQTISIRDGRNRPYLIIFLPIIDDDGVATDDILKNASLPGNVVGDDDYPIVLSVKDADLPAFNPLLKSQTLTTSSGGGSVTFDFRINRGACP